MLFKATLLAASSAALVAAQTLTTPYYNATVTSTGTSTVVTTTCYTTTVASVCPTGICSVTHTVTETITCGRDGHGCTRKEIPPGWTTKEIDCHHCGPTTKVTITCPEATPTHPPHVPPPHCDPHDKVCICKYYDNCPPPPPHDPPHPPPPCKTCTPPSHPPCPTCKPPVHPPPPCQSDGCKNETIHKPPPVMGSAGRSTVSSTVAGAVLLLLAPFLL